MEMVQISLADCTPEQANYLVALQEGWIVSDTLWLSDPADQKIGMPLSDWQPTAEWSQGGPIVEREGMATRKDSAFHEPIWVCDYQGLSISGSTLLLAAMRCFLMVKLGSISAEVPDILSVAKVDVCDATEKQLDWLVALCQSVELDERDRPIWFADAHAEMLSAKRIPYMPTVDWLIGGPMIEREGIHLSRITDALWEAWQTDRTGLIQNGPTPLIAACRCLVANKIGSIATVPRTLT